MQLNEYTAISTDRVLLVPYESHHVPTYHEWMKSPAIQQATASEPLTLEEEYENQKSWRASHDKLTFILCQPLDSATVSYEDDGRSGSIASISAGDDVDGPQRMIGDINFFLNPYDGDEDDEAGDAHATTTPLQENVAPSASHPLASVALIGGLRERLYVGEVDIMVAAPSDRRKGVGRAATIAFLHYIQQNLDAMLDEYDPSLISYEKSSSRTARGALRLRHFMTKIGQTNEASIGLFKSLGFQQLGGVDYFGEITLISPLTRDGSMGQPEGYREMKYVRPAM